MRSDAGAIFLEGEDVPFVVDTLFPLLDGTRTEPELIAAFPGIASDELSDLLQSLRLHGLVLESLQPDTNAPEATERRARLQRASVAMVGHAPSVAHGADAIRAAGVGQIAIGVASPDACDIAVGIFKEDDLKMARDFAQTAWRSGFPSLTCVVGRTEAVIGPFAVPVRTSCWNCARVRLHANAEWRRPPDASEAAATAEREIFERHLAREVCNAICLGAAGSPLVDHVLVIDRLSLRNSLHRVMGVPGCGVCGGPAHTSPFAGAHNATGDPQDFVLHVLSWFVDNRTGIVNRVIVDPPAESGLERPIVATAIPAAAPIETESPEPMPVGWGKGSTAATAVIGAVAEAIERYAGSMPDPARIVWARPAELSGSVFDPQQLALYADEQFARADFPFVRFDPDVAHPWIAGEWLGSRDVVWVPAILVYLSLDIRREQAFCQGTSNGMAAGMGWSDAGLRAVLELLERDAFMTSWWCRRPGTRVKLDATLDSDLAAIVEGVARLGARIELALLESVCGYPTAVCLGLGDGVDWPGVTLGLGTDPDARQAIRQAILELGQTGPYLRRLMKTDAKSIPLQASDVADMLDHARYYFPRSRAGAFDYLRAGPTICTLATMPAVPGRSLEACAAALAASGVRVALVDITPADVATTPFRVVRAVSPDLQTISFGYGHDRIPIPRIAAMGIRSSPDDIAPIW